MLVFTVQLRLHDSLETVKKRRKIWTTITPTNKSSALQICKKLQCKLPTNEWQDTETQIGEKCKCEKKDAAQVPIRLY